MFKKKKIREEFDEVFKSGDQKKIKQMLEENPWLLEEVSEEMNEEMEDEEEIIAAVGVMEDELGKPPTMNDILFCLKTDFEINHSEEEITGLLANIEKLDLIQKQGDGWILSKEGENICDSYLNEHLGDLEL
jgi:predicted transcriptional regulator